MASCSTVKKITMSYDALIYLPLKWKGEYSVKLLDCFKDIKAWMELHFLNINKS